MTFLVAQTADRYLRSPRLEGRPDGGAILHGIAWSGSEERAFELKVDAEGRPAGEPQLGARLIDVLALGPGSPPRRITDPVEEERASVTGWSVWIERELGSSRVQVLGPDFEARTIWQGRGTASAPAIAIAEGGVWVAFHHDVREDRGERDVAKWIALRFVEDDGTVLEPSAEMLDRDRDREGVEQSFEFPSIVVGDDGAVAIFGRGSHNFWRQDVDGDGFDPRQPLSDGEWGCRGRHVSAIRLTDGSLLIARRERRGIAIDHQSSPTGGPPALRPVRLSEPNEPRHEVPLGRGARHPSPSARREGIDARLTLFGDIHQHSAHSDGIGTADEAYLRARWAYGDDFCALTDHESFLGKRTSPGEWAHLQAVAERHDEPGRFATLIAYEWTGAMYPGPGHKVVYLPGTGLPIVSRDAVPEGRDLVAAVREQGGFAVPHHVGWTGADEAAHDPVGQPVWEICSCHGCYEYAEHPLGQRGDLRDQLVDAVLHRGHRFGFIACSDSHGLLRHHGVARKRDPFRTGLTAVQAHACTREAILSAIRERRCYATSGAKIIVDLRAGEAPMGSLLARSGPVAVRAYARGTTDLDRIELVGSEGVIAIDEPKGDEGELTVEVSGPYVYARIVQSDGEMAWSSPIFFS